MSEPRAQDASPSSREKILETAEALFARHGFAGLGMRAVAEQVGLSKSSLFHHFPTKLALYVAVLERGILELDLRLAEADPEGADPVARVSRWVDEIIDSFAEHPTRASLLLRALFETEVGDSSALRQVDEALSRVLSRVGGALDEARASNHLRDVSIPHTIQTLVGMIVYHFASGEFGDELLGRPVFSAVEVRSRKQHVQDFLNHALFTEPRS